MTEREFTKLVASTAKSGEKPDGLSQLDGLAPSARLDALIDHARYLVGAPDPLHEHDGYQPHSHEVRADHLGVPKH